MAEVVAAAPAPMLADTAPLVTVDTAAIDPETIEPRATELMSITAPPFAITLAAAPPLVEPITTAPSAVATDAAAPRVVAVAAATAIRAAQPAPAPRRSASLLPDTSGIWILLLLTVLLALAMQLNARATVRAPSLATRSLIASARPLGIGADEAEVEILTAIPGLDGFEGSIFGEDLDVNGEVNAQTPVRIDGRLIGTCIAPLVIVSASGLVEGAIAADTVMIHGHVTGQIYARHVLIARTAVITGDIAADWIEMAPGSHCDATFTRLPAEAGQIDGRLLGSINTPVASTTRAAA